MAKKKLEKENILILKRYQLHPASATTHCPKGSTDALSQPKQKKEKKSRYRVTILAAAAQPPPSQHLVSNSSKTPPSRRNQCQAQPIKARPWVFTLKIVPT